MSKSMTRLLAAALVAVAVPSFASIAAAAPVNGAFAIKQAAPSTVETVRWGGGWRGGGWRGGGWGRGWGWGGFAAGAVVGGLLAAPYYYGGYSPYYYSGYAPYYGDYAPYYGGGGYYVDRGGYYDDGGYGGGYRGGYRGGYAGGYARGYGGGGGGVDYCMQRYRTYDANSGTFMGSDGRRHPCP